MSGLKKKVNPGIAVFILALVVAIVGGAGVYQWINGGKERGVSMGEAMERDRKNAAARGEKPAVPDPNTPRPKMVNMGELLKRQSAAAEKKPNGKK